MLRRGGFAVDEKDNCGSTPLMDAVLNGHREVSELVLVKQKARLDTENNMGRQAIHQAAQTGNVEAIKYLILEHGVNVNVKSAGTSQVTPLHMAAKERHHKAISSLLDLGADSQSIDSRGRTALHIAAGVQDLNCVKVLLDHGAKDCKDQSGNFAKDLVFSSDLKSLF